MQQRIAKMLTTAILSAACFALPAVSAAQSRPSSDPTTTNGPTATPDPQPKRSPAADKNGPSSKKDPSVDRAKDAPATTAGGAEAAPMK